MKCEYDNGGCTAPIPVKCSDECIIRELQAELRAQLKDNYDCEKEYNALAKQYKSLLEKYNKLLAEIRFTD